MTRINTNVSSLIAQNTLQRSNADLQISLTRLSTGLRINTGKDDPAGLIASENLRRDITSIEKAISNSERANQLIATADSALGQVSSLLNDIRGLVTEAANSGALSDEQIAANQLQVDSSLEAIDRIAQVTTFQGRKLLDGNLAFITQAVSGFDTVSNLQVDQASLGATGSVSVSVEVAAAATQAQIDNTGGIAFTAGTAATGTLTFTDVTAATQASGTVTLNNGAFDVDAVASGSADGAAGNDIDVQIIDANTGDTATFDGSTIAVTVDITGGATIQDIVDAINANISADFTASTSDGGQAVVAGDEQTFADQTSGGNDATSADDVITVTAAAIGTAFNGNINVLSTGGVGTGIVASYDGTDITVTIENGATVNIADIATEIDNLTDFTASVTTNDADGQFVSGTDTDPTGTLAGGTDDSGAGLGDDLVVEISGATGSEVFTFQAGTTLAQLINAVNLVSDATGVQATNNGGNLQLTSTNYGSSAFVDVNVISEGASGTFAANLSATRDNGTDIDARVNGVQAKGDGNTLSINTATLDLSLTVDDGSSTDISFNITGGGALFQLGPDVVTNQQARLGIQSVNTARLGGSSGQLFQLRSGGVADLTTDATTAARIVDEAINGITSLRGRLGAFQKTTLETNIFSLNDTLSALTEAESSIRDADFAAESARLTRAQILVQSGTSVLAIANSNPQNVLALLR